MDGMIIHIQVPFASLCVLLLVPMPKWIGLQIDVWKNASTIHFIVFPSTSLSKQKLEKNVYFKGQSA